MSTPSWPAPQHQPFTGTTFAQVPPPRPERPLGSAVRWSLAINLVVTALLGAVLLLMAWLLAEWGAQMSGDDVSWSQTWGGISAGRVVLFFLAVLAGSLVVGSLLTVAALVLWRLLRGFRTLPPFVQALIAYVSMWVVTTVVSFVLQIAVGISGVLLGPS